MATIGEEIGRNGEIRKRILFTAGDGKRKTLRIGEANQQQAETVKMHVENILRWQATGVIDPITAKWLETRKDAMLDKLAAVGLVKPRNKTAATLGAFLDDYFANLNVKGSTLKMYSQTRRCLTEYFGEKKQLREIGPEDADKWRTWLKTANIRDNERDDMADATISRRIGVARMFFGKALKWKLIDENPFADVKAGSQKNKSRQFFITREAAQKVLDKCPDAEWKLLFALGRYGGLRCPSEHLALKWSDIDFPHKRIHISAPKTEHHEGKGERFIPLFPELEPLLESVLGEQLISAHGEKSDHVITRYRDPSVNLRTQLLRILKRAGVTAWPKLWNNLRSSCVTEWHERFPAHVACAWAGHGLDVARDHYTQVLDAHFAKALEPINPSAQSAAQIPAQPAAKSSATEEKAEDENLVLAGETATAMSGGDEKLSVLGLEPRTP